MKAGVIVRFWASGRQLGNNPADRRSEPGVEVHEKRGGKFDSLTPEVAANPVFEKLLAEYLKVDRLLSRERSSPFP
jgi:hypothetical protein